MSARERILDAAADIMRRHGVARATTKEIAKAAGYSEALLYKHFRDKEELMLNVLKERMPPFTSMGVPGEGTVESNLVAVVHGGLRFYRQAFPMMASMAAQPRLMNATRDSLRKYGAGPQEPVRALARYLDAERALGRVAADADTAAVAALLMGACFQQGFLLYFAGDPSSTDDAGGAGGAGITSGAGSGGASGAGGAGAGGSGAGGPGAGGAGEVLESFARELVRPVLAELLP